MKRIATLAALVLAGLALTACGGSEPAAAPQETSAVESQRVASTPVSEPQDSDEPVETTAADCWTALPYDDPNSWQTRYNGIAAPELAVKVLDALPDPSSGCTELDIASLQEAADLSARVHRLMEG